MDDTSYGRPMFAPARAVYYAEWVRLHLDSGGHITHFYDYPMPSEQFLIAQAPFALGGEYGANARHILVPGDIAWDTGTGLGHNTVHLANGTMIGSHVPVYTDQAFQGLPGWAEGIIAARRRTEAWRAEHAARMAREPHSDLTRYAAHAEGRNNGDGGLMVAPSGGAQVYVKDGQVCLLPSSMPLRLTPEAALALAEDLRAAALGARQ